MSHHWIRVSAMCLLLPWAGCTDDDFLVGGDDSRPNEEAGESEGETGIEDPNRATVTHSFGTLTLDAFEESEPCVSWTLNNEEAVYVNTVTLANTGAWHHSNWFVVPDGTYPGPDGFWKCSERDFEEIKSATAGTVLYAQSTQSWLEVQQLNEGAVIKIPPHHTIVGGTHALNLAPREVETELRMSLEIIHPMDVETVLTPMRLSFLDLTIPPMAQSHFRSQCDMNFRYEQATGRPLDIKLHYVLPHYHYLGNFFQLKMMGGERDGEVLYELNGFDAEANGRVFFPPIDFTGATGVEFSCGYDNFTNEEVGWGIGDQEMCVMLGLAESERLLENTVLENDGVFGVEDEVVVYEGGCVSLSLSKNPRQGPPTQEEIDGEFYIPPSDPDDQGLPPVPECEDTPADATALVDATLTSLRANVFVPACNFSSCHGKAAAGDIDFTSPTLRAELLAHENKADTDMPLIDPGNPDNSWFMQVISKCEPTTEGGQVRNHMPRNAPVLLDPGLVAAVRDWIAAGAPDN